MDIGNEILHSMSMTFGSVVGFIPTIISAVLVLILGWILAKIVKWIVFKLFRTLDVDKFIENSRINKYLQKRNMHSGISGLFSSLVYWIIILVVITNFFNQLGFEVFSSLLNELLLFIPNFLVACVLMIIGFYLAEIVSGFVVGSLEEENIENPEMIGKLVFGGIAFFTVAMALTQIGIGEGIITNVVSIFFGAIGLAFAIAFGLGGREWATGILNKYFTQKKDIDNEPRQ